MSVKFQQKIYIVRQRNYFMDLAQRTQLVMLCVSPNGTSGSGSAYLSPFCLSLSTLPLHSYLQACVMISSVSPIIFTPFSFSLSLSLQLAMQTYSLTGQFVRKFVLAGVVFSRGLLITDLVLGAHLLQSL